MKIQLKYIHHHKIDNLLFFHILIRTLIIMELHHLELYHELKEISN